MNEEQKNIETCLPENILSEVANVPTDPQFRSLVEESFDPLKQQALQQAGYDGYEKVVWTHKPYTFTSQVKQMKSNLILLLRRLWRLPFGRGTASASAAGSSDAGSTAGSASASAAAPIRSLADMWQHYITRLKGNPEYGIPSRLSSLTDLPDAPALLADRKIGGVPEAVDGISLVHLLCSQTITEVNTLTDSTHGWSHSTRALLASMLGILSNVDELHANFTSLTAQLTWSRSAIRLPKECFFDEIEDATTCAIFGGGEGGFTNIELLSMAKLKKVGGLFDDDGNGWWGKPCSIKTIHMPELVEIVSGNSGRGVFISFGLSSMTKLELPKLEKLSRPLYGGNAFPILTELRMPSLKRMSSPLSSNSHIGTTPKLLLLEVGAMETSANLSGWVPDSETLEHQDFLMNFKTYIAERLTDKGTGLTLTLSQEVRNAIHAAEDEYGIENIIITQKGWTISPAPN